ncbi:MAG: chemotaxis protein CheB [Rhodanobacter sp.]|jgi:two-component system chemotaxis response regulator CheB/chemosensory pili system protein ChpB (putative protein-glutamate methylesterase)
MTEQVPAVALLFDDTELGAHLRNALNERGARIVHEGVVATLSRELLQEVGADVIVVNLDNSADDALDSLYELMDGDRPRLVFNDAQASRGLSGWDRARWARHLAVKVLAAGDFDPPRPHESRAVEVPVGAALPQQETAAGDVISMVVAPVQGLVDEPVDEAMVTAEPGVETSDFAEYDQADIPRRQEATTESESLASELEALLASGDLQEEEPAGPGMRYFDNDALHDGNFGETALAVEGDDAGNPGETAEPSSGQPPQAAAAPAAAVFQLDHLELTAMTDSSPDTAPSAVPETAPSIASPTVRAPDAWSLLDDESLGTEDISRDKPDASAFGIEKMSAADFLAPEGESAPADFEPTMSLELVSMEEAVAPQAYVHDGEHEMVLDELGSVLSRVVLLGAAIDGVDSVCEFLAALPASTRLTFLHTQHLGEHSDIALAEKFSMHSALPVRLARQRSRAGAGEVLMVPAGQQVRLRRDGSVELQSLGSETELDPSIDSSFTMAANAFGRDALAIVFAGRGNDAVAGAQAIHDRGGEVWVESSSGEHFADMVSGIFAERLVGFSGTPSELAAHLLEVFS